MNLVVETLRWSDWLKEYELKDPEPELRWESGSTGHYQWHDVLEHIAWHGRMTRAWRGAK